MTKIALKPNTLLMPTPVVMASCIGSDGKPNIITLAWVGIVASVPPMVSVSIRPSRFSYALIKDSSEFVINIPSEKMIKETDGCGNVSGRDVDKFEHFKLTAVEAKEVKAPLIKECSVNLECKVSNILNLGSHDMFVAEVIALHADEEVLTDGKIDPAKLRPIAYCPHDYWSLSDKIGTYGFSQKVK